MADVGVMATHSLTLGCCLSRLQTTLLLSHSNVILDYRMGYVIFHAKHPFYIPWCYYDLKETSNHLVCVLVHACFFLYEHGPFLGSVHLHVICGHATSAPLSQCLALYLLDFAYLQHVCNSQCHHLSIAKS